MIENIPVNHAHHECNTVQFWVQYTFQACNVVSLFSCVPDRNTSPHITFSMGPSPTLFWKFICRRSLVSLRWTRLFDANFYFFLLNNFPKLSKGCVVASTPDASALPCTTWPKTRNHTSRNGLVDDQTCRPLHDVSRNRHQLPQLHPTDISVAYVALVSREVRRESRRHHSYSRQPHASHSIDDRIQTSICAAVPVRVLSAHRPSVRPFIPARPPPSPPCVGPLARPPPAGSRTSCKEIRRLDVPDTKRLIHSTAIMHGASEQLPRSRVIRRRQIRSNGLRWLIESWTAETGLNDVCAWLANCCVSPAETVTRNHTIVTF